MISLTPFPTYIHISALQWYRSWGSRHTKC